jgi:hypothetical protein
MPVSLCYWTLEVWRNIGRIWSWVHYLPLACGCLSVLYLVWRSVTSVRRINLSDKIRESRITSAALQSLKTAIRRGVMRNRNRGFARWWAVLFAGSCLLILLTGAFWQKPTVERNVAVVEINGEYRYTFQPVDEHDRLIGSCDPRSPDYTCFTVDICRDFASPKGDFLPGIILNRLIHTVEAGCWSLNPDKHCGYYKRRDAARNAIYVAKE